MVGGVTSPPAHLQTFPCPHCGASTPITGEGSEVGCVYCGERVRVPAETRVAPALDRATRDALEEGRGAVRRIIEREGGAGMAGEPIAVIVGIVVGFVVLARMYDSADASFVLAGLACTTSWLVVSFVGIFLGQVLGRGVARYRAWRLDQAIELRRREASCPRCGAPVGVPGGTVVLDCAHCDARMVAAEGLLAAWSGDLAESVEAWKREAKAIADRQSVWAGRIAAFVIFAFLFGATVGAWIYGFYRALESL